MKPKPELLRGGVAAIEFAMTAPLVFLLLYAALELGHANMAYNAVEAACYEGARVGIVPGAQASECRAAAQRVLELSNIRGGRVTVTPSNLSTNTQAVEVRVRLRYKGTAILPPTFTRLLSIDRRCVLVREKP